MQPSFQSHNFNCFLCLFFFSYVHKAFPFVSFLVWRKKFQAYFFKHFASQIFFAVTYLVYFYSVWCAYFGCFNSYIYNIYFQFQSVYKSNFFYHQERNFQLVCVFYVLNAWNILFNLIIRFL